jgi:hypothetical protein
MGVVRIRLGVASALAASVLALGVGCGSSGTRPAGDQGPRDGGGTPEAASGGGAETGAGSADDASASSGEDAGAMVGDSGLPDVVSTGGDASSSDAASCATTCSGVCDQGTCKTCSDTAGCSGSTPVCDTAANGGMGQCVQVQILAFELTDAKMLDRAHAAYQRHANVWFPQTGKSEGFFTFTVTNDWTQLETIKPKKGLIVMFVDISPADVALAGADQSAIQKGFQAYMEAGGAWFGSHYSAYNDCSPQWNWPWYFNEFLGGGLFTMNTWEPVSVNLDVEDPTHPVSQGLGSMFKTAPSEWYSWTNDLRTMSNIKILFSVDPSSFPVGTDPTQSWTSGYYPIAWTNTNYKMMYVNMGHELMDYSTDTALSSAFTSPMQNTMYTNAFRWLGGAQK